MSKTNTLSRRLCANLSAGIAILLVAESVSAASFANKAIVDLLIDVNSRPCVFFTLAGVTEADPVVPTNPWFAVAKSASNFTEVNAMLLSAKLAGRPISVFTDGTTSCGLATVSVVNIN